MRGKERLEFIYWGLDAGKSRRRIAAELGVDEGTVRRDIRILLLPESSLTSILNGAPAEQHIRAAQREAAQNAKQLQLAAEREAGKKSMKQRIAEENISQCHSNALARLLLRALKDKWGGGYAEQLIGEVERENGSVADRLVIPSSNPSKTQPGQ